MLDKFKRLFKDSAIYGIGTIIHSGVNFFMIPVYTKAFHPAEYGIIDLLVTLSVFLGVIAIAGMDTAMSFFFYEKKESGESEAENQKKVVSAIFQFKLIWGVILVLICTLFSPILNTHFFFNKLHTEIYAMAFLAGLALEFVNQNALVFRLKFRPWSFVGVITGQTLTQALLISLFIFYFKFGIWGYFLGYLASTMVFGVVSSIMIKDVLEFSFDKALWIKIIKFSLPLFFSGVAMYVLQSSDRLIISKLTNADTLGIYAVGARFSLFMMLFVYTFRQAWTPIAMKMIHDVDDHTFDFFRLVAKTFMGIAVVLVILLNLFSKLIVQIFSSVEYISSYPLIGVLAWSWIFYGLFAIVSVGILKSQKNYWYTFTMIITAILNIVLNLLLIPAIDILGAALATAISFLLWVIIITIVSEKLWKIGFPYTNLFIQVVIGAIFNYLIVYYLRTDNYMVAIPVAMAGICITVPVAFDFKHFKAFFRELREKI